MTPVRQHGFTLLEIMIALSIMSILFSTALVNIPFDSPSRKLRQESERLFALMRLASEESVLDQSHIGIRFDDNGYSFLRLGAKKANKSAAPGTDGAGADGFAFGGNSEIKIPTRGWHSLTHSQLRPKLLPSEVEFQLRIDDIEVHMQARETEELIRKKLPHLIFPANGDLFQDFEIELRLKGEDRDQRYLIMRGQERPLLLVKPGKEPPDAIGLAL